MRSGPLGGLAVLGRAGSFPARACLKCTQYRTGADLLERDGSESAILSIVSIQRRSLRGIGHLRDSGIGHVASILLRQAAKRLVGLSKGGAQAVQAALPSYGPSHTRPNQ